MRLFAAMLVLAWTATARADCTAAPDRSSERSVSEAPYDVPPAERCPAESQPGLEPKEGWAADRDQTRVQLTRFGALGVALGGVILLTGAGLALCARDSDPGTNGFCRSAWVPTLIGGAAVSALGMATLAVGTWVIPERDSRGRASISAGANVRLAWDFPR